MKRWRISVCTVPLILLVTASARASVSIAVSWEGLLRDSNASALVTPVESRCLWEDGRISTYTRVRVDRAVAGELRTGDEAWVRTAGGAVGKVGQIVEGEAVLVPGQSSLLFLRSAAVDPSTYEVTARGQGQFPLVLDGEAGSRLVRSAASGMLVRLRAASAEEGARLATEWIDGRSPDDVALVVAGWWERTHAP